MNEEQIRATIYSKIDEVPTLPTVVPKLLRMVESTLTSASDVAEAISHDPALTSRILKVANSAYYGFPQEITTLDKAVALLGFNMVKSLALSIGVIHSLPSGGRSVRFSEQGLWSHSLAVATAMDRIVRILGKENERDYLFIVGLLHDIGKIVLAAFFPELFEQIVQDLEETGRRRVFESEQRIMGFDHGEVGAMLLTRWRLPPIIVDPIAVHHREDVPDGIDRSDISMLRVADDMALELGIGEKVPPEGLIILPEDLAILGFTEKNLYEVRSHLEEAKEGILDFSRALS